MKRMISLGVILASGLLATSASADILDGSAVISSKMDANGVDFDYTITLTNSSTSNVPIGTFWFSWVPGQDFMTNRPISETTPNGWVANITNGGPTDGFAIQWIAGTTTTSNPAVAIDPGASLTFGFVSAETPAQLAGNSQFHPTFPELTAFLYNGIPFSDAGTQITVSAVPEPSTMALSLIGGLGLLASRRLRRRKASQS
jgi:hypothetical protein